MPSLEFKGKSLVYAHHLAVPFRELLIDAKKSLPAAGAKPSLDDNLIVHGDNLHALKALLPVYAGKVDCIFIDPPYNTGNESWCYNDNVRSPLMREWLKKASPVDKEDLERHDKWLCMMWPRLKLLHELLNEDGAIFVSIDDNEGPHLRAMMDEIFGEDNFIDCIIWQKNYSPKNTAQYFSSDHDYILAYAKKKEVWRPYLLQRTERQDAAYKNPDNDPRGRWKTSDLSARNYYSEGTYPIKCPSGRVIERPPEGNYWRVAEKKFWALDSDHRIWWGKDGDSIPQIKRFLSDVKPGRVPQTLWFYADVGHTDEAKKELKAILDYKTSEDVFITPKPVRLIQRILEIATDEESLVLDSFAGSGTTAQAVLALNKKDGGNRRFILVECENYADTLTAERVRRVIKGYKFQGRQREELFREPITWTKLKKAADLVAKAEAVARFEEANFDKITKTVEDGQLLVVGEKKISEKTEGLGGSFAYIELGPEISLETLLDNGLPSFEALAKYVFFTATGQTLSHIPKSKAAASGLIGETDVYRIYLLYKPDKNWLMSNEAALTENLVDAMVAANPGKKRILVFAAVKYMGQRELTRKGVEFCQLPYAIHRILGD